MATRNTKHLNVQHKPKQSLKVVEQVKEKPYNKWSWINYSLKLRKITPTCNICKRLFTYDKLCVDHIIPIIEGGSFWDIKNHQCLCIPCHSRKTNSEQSGSRTNYKFNEDNEKVPI